MPTLPTTLPLPGISTSGTTHTVDVLLTQPLVISRLMADVVNQGFFIPALFTPKTLTGGSMEYEIPPTTGTDVYMNRDLERQTPLAKVPTLTADRGTPTAKPAETWAGRYQISTEARIRNQAEVFTRENIQMGNTVQRKLHQVALTEFDSAISTYTRTAAAAQTLATANAKAMTARANTDTVLAPWILANKNAALELRGNKYDTTIIHPDTEYQIGLQFGFSNGGVAAAFRSIGLEVIVSPLVTAGTAYLMVAKSFGVMAWETLPQVTTYVSEEDRCTFVQVETSFACAVIDPYQINQITGL